MNLPMINMVEAMYALRVVPIKNSLPGESLNFLHTDTLYSFSILKLKGLVHVTLKMYRCRCE